MHWSYAENDDGDLAQGDILLPNDRLRSTLGQVHRWFDDPKYLGFIVLSQTCDLVRRDGQICKAPYITIAVVRLLREYLLALLGQQCKCIADGYFLAAEKSRAIDLLNRVINQNEAAVGLFYLHPDASIGIAEEAVALLRVSIALRSREHYETLLSARTGRLTPEFGNKLGWLCGNLFSRVGVSDWTETEERQDTAKRLIDSLLGGEGDWSPKFVDSRKFKKEFDAGRIHLQNANAEQIEAELAKFSGPSFKESAILAVSRILQAQQVADQVIAHVKQNLSNDAAFNRTLRQGSE